MMSPFAAAAMPSATTAAMLTTLACMAPPLEDL
jgi:hypothetical protein